VKRKVKIILGYVTFVFVIVALVLIWESLPIISGYGAKTLCSGIFVSGRHSADVIKQELGSFPLNLGSFVVDLKDSSVTGSVLGLAKKKAIFRTGVGATLLNGVTEAQLKRQKIIIASPPPVNQDTVNWPQGDKIRYGIGIDSVSDRKFDRSRLDSAIGEAFEDGKPPVRRTRAVIVVYDGKIIAERYAAGYSINSKMNGLSMTKSITNALIGILVKAGKLDIEKPAQIDEWQKDDRRQITITNLMQMNSGLKWWEYPYASSDFTKMLFKEKSMSAYSLKAPLED